MEGRTLQTLGDYLHPDGTPEKPQKACGNRDQHKIVSIIAYLIGVEERNFDDNPNHLQKDIYDDLEKDDAAKVIRALCSIRQKTEINFKKLLEKKNFEQANILLQDCFDQEKVQYLTDSGIKLPNDPGMLVVELNKQISQRLGNCNKLFEDWLKWDYIRDLFIMPGGNTVDGCKEAIQPFYDNRMLYPFSTYINWEPKELEHQLFYNDRFFVTTIYSWHNDTFTDYSRVSDVSQSTKQNIYSFLNEANKAIVAVDCENSDVFALCAALKGLESSKLKKIDGIMLFDDENASKAWKMLSEYTDIPVEHILVERLLDHKSVVDQKMIIEVCRKHWTEDVDSFIIASSDSDYHTLFSSLNDTRFLVMMERDAASPKLKNRLLEMDIPFCFIDDFYDGNGEDEKKQIIMTQMREILNKNISLLNIDEAFNTVLASSRIKMNEEQYEMFKKKYLSNIAAELENGTIHLDFAKR